MAEISIRKYISLDRLRNFLEQLELNFALKTHKHTSEDVTHGETSLDEVLDNYILDVDYSLIAFDTSDVE